jgi:cation transport ATPase
MVRWITLSSGPEGNIAPSDGADAGAKRKSQLWRTLIMSHAMLAIMVVVVALIQGNEIGLELWQWVSVIIFTIVMMGACVWIPGLAFFALMRNTRNPDK